MNKDKQRTCKQAESFIQNLFRVYLEERDFARLITMFHQDITWVGTGAHETCKNYQDALSLMEAERDSWEGHFKINEQWYQAVPLDDEFCIVFGELKIVEDGINSILMEMHSRCSMICCRCGEEFKLYHAHFSVPNAAQTEDEFVHQSLVQDYNRQLEEKLEERTKMLQSKTSEMELLANYIFCGVQICKYEEGFPILYASKGFVELTGYCQEELDSLFGGRHIGLVFQPDLELLQTQIAHQLKTDVNFSVEYRLVHKSGRIVWVIDKGKLIPAVDGTAKVQCILTDITEQKVIEEELRLSQKRYEIAMMLSEVSMFEHNIVTKDLILFENDVMTYGVTEVVPNGVETFVATGIVEPESADVFRAMYQRIYDGEPTARCYVKAKDVNNVIHDVELTLNSIYDSDGKPVRAIGVRRNVTQMRQLQKENEFGKTLLLDKNFVCEADVTNDTVMSINQEWADEIALPQNSSFSDAVIRFCETLVSPVHRMMVLQHFSKQSILRAFESGEKLVSFSYQVKSTMGDYIWYEATINIIKEQENIIIRYYIEDIDEKKRQEQKMLEERRIYSSMFATSAVVYEVDITRNRFLGGHEKWGQLFGIQQTDNYADMMQALVQKAIHPEDARAFCDAFLLPNVLNAYKNDQTRIMCEYRRPNESGEFIWVRCMLHLFLEQSTNNLQGHAYIENINAEKQKQLELIYKAEHDPLTGLYNKAATEKHIVDFLATSEGKSGIHAFFILDIDHFKSVNDHFGHAFGDAVLSQVATRISELFRDGDVLGRIGGDEFVMFLKNISREKVALRKAEELCNNVVDTFTQKGATYKISASIGLALYSEHGRSYSELYKNSDRALYMSKENGRHQFTVYRADMPSMGLGTNEIDGKDFSEIKTFEENVTEFVFRILYESTDKLVAIQSVLELVGKHYNTSHAYIFECLQGEEACLTFEWCGESYVPKLFSSSNITNTGGGNYQDNFSSSGIFFMADSSKTKSALRAVLEAQGIKSMLQFTIVKNGKFVGFIGFDECRYFRVPTNKEIEELKHIANILGVFIAEMRAVEETACTKNVAMSIINGLDSYAYVCDPQTHKILIANEKTMGLAPGSKTGVLCHELLWNRPEPCEVCPMKTMRVNRLPSYTMELHNPHLGKCLRATASWINWMDGGEKCLVNYVDISAYK